MYQGSAHFAMGEQPRRYGSKTRAEPQARQELDTNLEGGNYFQFQSLQIINY